MRPCYERNEEKEKSPFFSVQLSSKKKKKKKKKEKRKTDPSLKNFFKILD